jgi:hypothetical protein
MALDKADIVSPTHGPIADQTGLARYFNKSVMTVWRWRRSLPDFPRPAVIAGRNYWRIRDIEDWFDKHVQAPPPAPVPHGARADQARSQAVRRGEIAKRKAKPRERLPTRLPTRRSKSGES